MDLSQQDSLAACLPVPSQHLYRGLVLGHLDSWPINLLLRGMTCRRPTRTAGLDGSSRLARSVRSEVDVGQRASAAPGFSQREGSEVDGAAVEALWLVAR